MIYVIQVYEYAGVNRYLHVDNGCGRFVPTIAEATSFDGSVHCYTDISRRYCSALRGNRISVKQIKLYDIDVLVDL